MTDTNTSLKRKQTDDDAKPSPKEGVLRLDVLPKYCRHLGGSIFAMVNVFQGVPRVNIREYKSYEGKENFYPTKQGVVLFHREWNQICSQFKQDIVPSTTNFNENGSGISWTVKHCASEVDTLYTVELRKVFTTKNQTICIQSVKLSDKEWTLLFNHAVNIRSELVETEIGLKVLDYISPLPEPLVSDLLLNIDYVSETFDLYVVENIRFFIEQMGDFKRFEGHDVHEYLDILSSLDFSMMINHFRGRLDEPIVLCLEHFNMFGLVRRVCKLLSDIYEPSSDEEQEMDPWM